MDFKQVSKKYRPIPFWSWNEKLDPEETREQIKSVVLEEFKKVKEETPAD